MAVATSGFLGVKGIAGVVYRLEQSTFAPYLEDGALVVLDANGFYRVEILKMDEVKRHCRLKITPFPSKKKFIKVDADESKSSWGGGYSIIYNVDNQDQIVDELGNIITPGTYDTWFDKSIVTQRNFCEQYQAINFILSLNGSNRCQVWFPIDFTGMTVDNITQTNINNALS